MLLLEASTHFNGHGRGHGRTRLGPVLGICRVAWAWCQMVTDTGRTRTDTGCACCSNLTWGPSLVPNSHGHGRTRLGPVLGICRTRTDTGFACCSNLAWGQGLAPLSPSASASTLWLKPALVVTMADSEQAVLRKAWLNDRKSYEQKLEYHSLLSESDRSGLVVKLF